MYMHAYGFPMLSFKVSTGEPYNDSKVMFELKELLFNFSLYLLQRNLFHVLILQCVAELPDPHKPTFPSTWTNNGA